MDQNNRMFYEDRDGAAQDNEMINPYDDGYEEYEYDYEDMGDASDAYDYAEDEPEEDISGYEDEIGDGRFRVAMNVFDMVSVLMGVVVILALTAMLVSIVSWLRTDIIHSFVLLQSRIQ